ncbi:protein LURP-one-related 15-like [Trifolium pratense]|uniref:protein LURP-one-related 15-like n=1 Tax=Trifolium pratense TaxID=57577 RepID=UPI001E691C2E|nr:protein LURP-one-related 15-like [Trifolium pratense]
MVTSLFLQLLVKDSWKAFRGESIEPKHLIFRKKRSSLLQLKTKLNVFLASNNTGVCDFTVKGSFFGLSWKVYSGNSNIVVAKIIKLGGIFSREKFIVNICPNIDCAFIVALIVSLPK